MIEIPSDGELKLSYPAKLFEPYVVMYWTVTVIKGAKTGNRVSKEIIHFLTYCNSVTILVVEIDIPLLTVSVPDKFFFERINLNDDIKIDIDYYKPPDLAFYSLIFIYEYEVVASKKFDYISFKFKIWDIYSDFTR